MMRSMVRLMAAACLLCAGVAAASCTKDSEETPDYNFNFCPDPNSIDPGIIQQELVSYNHSFDLTIKPTNVFSWKGDHFDVEIMTPQEYVSNFVELHIDMLPLYVFGTDDYSGDYYSVTGYVVAHNAACFSKDSLYRVDGSKVDKVGWYMGDLCVDAQLLDDKGNAVTNDKVRFLITPEPSTTIGETTYTKGFSFSLAPALTFGSIKKTTEGIPSWKTIGLGVVSFGFNWSNSSTQVIPDQTVTMWTGIEDRSVSYEFLTNNLKEEETITAIPAVARNDQRFDFSWVWKVDSGCYAASDGSFGNMKMKFTINPKLKTNVFGYCKARWKEKDSSGKEVERVAEGDVNNFFADANIDPLEYTIDLPAMNRIPTAKFTIKNCTTSYMTNLRVYRSGEYGFANAYDEVQCILGQNESVESLLREGTYDIIYELKNGNTGESRGNFIISDVTFGANDALSLTTFDGKKIEE